MMGQQLPAQWAAMGLDQQAIGAMRGWMLSAEGKATWMLAAMLLLVFFLVVFATAGGVIGARLVSRNRRQHI